MELFEDGLLSIHARLKVINKLWDEQSDGGVFIEFPNEFPVDSPDMDRLGVLKLDETGSHWIFLPAVKEEE